MYDDFLDKVFDTDSILPRTNFEKAVRKNYPAVFDSAELRKMVLNTENIPDSDNEEFDESDSDSDDDKSIVDIKPEKLK